MFLGHLCFDRDPSIPRVQAWGSLCRLPWWRQASRDLQGTDVDPTCGLYGQLLLPGMMSSRLVRAETALEFPPFRVCEWPWGLSPRPLH